MTASITFDQMERNADRTLAVVLWAKHVKNIVLAALWFAVLNQALRSLVKSLSGSGKLNSLSDDQVKELTAKLQEIHEHARNILDHDAICFIRRTPLLKSRINRLEENVEDISDVIENLILSCNPEFRALVADCVQKVSSAHSAEPVAHM